MMQQLAALQWWLRRTWLRVGVAELVLVALACTSCALWYRVTTPLNSLRDEAAADLAYLESRHQVLGEHAGVAELQARAAVDNLLVILPAGSSREQALKHIGIEATQAGTVWLGSEYQEEPIEGLPVTRTTARLSVRGDYPALRAFIRNLLASTPNLAVTQLTIEGGAGSSEQPTLSLETRLYFRHDTGHASP